MHIRWITMNDMRQKKKNIYYGSNAYFLEPEQKTFEAFGQRLYIFFIIVIEKHERKD